MNQRNRIIKIAYRFTLGFALVLALGMSTSQSLLAKEAGTEPDTATLAMISELGLRQHSVASRDFPGWKPPQKIVIRTLAQDQSAAIQRLIPGAEVIAVSSLEQALAEVSDADVVIGYCEQSLLRASKQLRWLQIYSAGVEHCINSPVLQQGKVLISNGQRLASPALAEHAITFMMMLMRGMDLFHSQQLKENWQANVGDPSNTFLELQGRTVLVVGLGGIGTGVAKRAHALGMRVIATRGSKREGPEYIEYVGLADETISLAAGADVVINTVPLTSRTRGIFNTTFFKSMPKSAYFISVGRGASTVTADLVAALENGDIAGAGLDVTDPEPLPAGHPLWSMPRVLITPHTGWRSDQSRPRLHLLVMENLRRYAAGEPLLSVVDPQRGY